MAQIIKERKSQTFIITKKTTIMEMWKLITVNINSTISIQYFAANTHYSRHSWHMPKNWTFDPNGIFYAKRNCASKVAFERWAKVWNVCWLNVVSMLYVQHVLRWHNVAPTCWPYDGPTSKLTLGQRSLSTFGQRSGQSKYSVGPTVSCYLRYIVAIT